jgi:truncated hemoglobin YjbI
MKKIEPLVRSVLTEFYERVFNDHMIGYMFSNKDKQRLIQKEVELTMNFLGSDTPYSGLPIKAVHAPLQIKTGQFNRRIQILKDCLNHFKVSIEIQKPWLEHSEAFRQVVTRASC